MLKLWCLNPNLSSQGQQLWVKYANLFQWWTVRASMAFSAVLHILRKICIYLLLFFFKDVNAIIRHSLSSSCHIHQAMLLTMLYIVVELLSNQISADRKDVSHGCDNIFKYFGLACFKKTWNEQCKKKRFVSLKLTDNLVLLNHLFDFHIYLFQRHQQSKYVIFLTPCKSCRPSIDTASIIQAMLF